MSSTHSSLSIDLGQHDFVNEQYGGSYDTEVTVHQDFDDDEVYVDVQDDYETDEEYEGFDMVNNNNKKKKNQQKLKKNIQYVPGRK